jgi:protein-arginine kinase activator protein McsA
MTRRCYKCHTNPAVYVAKLDYDFTPQFLLCIDCAAGERAWGSVIEIKTLR